MAFSLSGKRTAVLFFLTKLHTILLLIIRARQSLLSECQRISTLRFLLGPRPGACGLVVPGGLLFYHVLF